MQIGKYCKVIDEYGLQGGMCNTRGAILVLHVVLCLIPFLCTPYLY